jgi:hypothetical protein
MAGANGEMPIAAESPNERSSLRVSACSACPGDYEDPDRTAGEEFEVLLAEEEEAAEPQAEEPEAEEPETEKPEGSE